MRTFTILKNIFMGMLLLFLFTNVSFAQDCDLFEDFEILNPNAAYAGRTVTTPNGDWWMVGYSTMDVNDRRIDDKSIRLRAGANDSLNNVTGENTKGANVVEMLFDKPNGVGKVSFFYGSYSTHNGGVVSVEYSTDGGTTWIKPDNNAVTSPAWTTVNEMQEFTVLINVQGNVRVRLIKYKQTGSTSVNVDNLCVTDFIEEGVVFAPKFNPPGGSYTGTVNVTITSDTPDATIRYTLDGNDPTLESSVYSTPVAISIQTTLKAKAWKEEMEPSPITTATYIFPQSVSTLAELRALAPEYTGGNSPGSAVFKYTGTATITHVQNFNNVKYIQDGTAAIMIFDPNPKKLQDGLEVTDKITNITGTLTNYFGMLQIIPTGPCDRAGYDGQVPATLISVAQIDNNHNNPAQAKVIKIEEVSYVQTGTFGRGRYYDLKQNNVVYDSVVFTDKYEALYIEQPIPTYAVNILGVCNFTRGANIQGISTRNRIVPLDDETAVPIANFSKAAIQLAPNPANSFVNIVTGTPMRLEVYGLLGNLMTAESLYEGTNTISVSNYPAGIYLMKLTEYKTGKSFMQKLVVR